MRVAAENLDEYRSRFLRIGDFRGYLRTFDAHERFKPFVDKHRLMGDKTYWKCLADVWYGIETSYQHRYMWLFFFSSHRLGREQLMARPERRHLVNLPVEITIFRGYAKGKVRSGLSWTLSEKVARRMAVHAVGPRRVFMCGFAPGQTGVTVRAKALKRDVLAYFNDRKEQEIVIDPKKVFEIRQLLPVQSSSWR